MIWLTPPVFADPSRRPDAASHYPAIGLYIGESNLWGTFTRPDGTTEDGPVTNQIPGLVTVDCPSGSAPPESPIAPVDWVGGVSAVYDAVMAAINQRWDLFGKSLDIAHAHERNATSPNGRRDLVYAAGRTAGAWGGRGGEGVVSFICPPEKVEAVRKAAADQQGSQPCP